MERNTIFWIHISFIEEYERKQCSERIKALLNVYYEYLMRIDDVGTLSEIAKFTCEQLYNSKEGRELIEQIR